LGQNNAIYAGEIVGLYRGGFYGYFVAFHGVLSGRNWGGLCAIGHGLQAAGYKADSMAEMGQKCGS